MKNISNEALSLFVFHANLLAKKSHKFPCMRLVKMEEVLRCSLAIILGNFRGDDGQN